VRSTSRVEEFENAMNMMNRKHTPPSKSRSIAFAAAFGLAVILLSGVVYGHYTRRWGAPPDLAAAAKQLETFPTQFGDWKLKSDHEMSSSVVNMLECAGYVNRTYVNSKTGEAVALAIIVALPVRSPSIRLKSAIQVVIIPSSHRENR